QIRLQSQDLGKHLRGVDDLLQLHALVEADVAAQAERVRGLSAAAQRFTGAGYQPCDPATVQSRVATLELRYRELAELAAERRGRLEESRRLWKFFWDAGEEEAWMREQERLLSSPEVGWDLTSSLRLLSQHDAFLGELSARAGPLQQTLARGRSLAAGADQATQRAQEVEELWRSLGLLASRREGLLREAAGAFQFQAEVADVEAWLEDACLLVSSPELGRDEFSTRSLARQHQEVEEELRKHRGAVEGLREQAARLPPAAAAAGAGRLEALERRYREVWGLAEGRRQELEATLTFYTTRSEADACGLWLAEKEQWLHAMEVPDRLEDLEVVQQRFETLEQEMISLGARVAAVNQASEQLLATDRRNQDSIQATRQDLNARWESFHLLAGQKKELVTSALALQNFHLECTETAAWMLEKTKLLDSSQGWGTDLAASTTSSTSGLATNLAASTSTTSTAKGSGTNLAASSMTTTSTTTSCTTMGSGTDLAASTTTSTTTTTTTTSTATLQRRLSGLARDLEAIQAKVEELEAEGTSLGLRQPGQRPAVTSRLASLGSLLEELRRRLQGCQEALGEAGRLQNLLRDLTSIQAWLSRAKVALASGRVPTSPGEAQELLSQHQGVKKEMAQYGADYCRAKELLGQEVVVEVVAARGKRDPQQQEVLRRRLEALETSWEELGRMWEERQQLLAQALDFQVFLRDAKRVEGEYALSHTEMPDTLPGAEAALKKHEDFMATMEATGEQLQGLVGSSQKLVAEGGLHAQNVQEMVEKVESSRHRRNQEVAQELLAKLKDNLELQRFLQDGQELTLWMEEKMLMAQDVSYEGGRDLHTKWQKHQAFAAELAANRGWLEKMEKEGLQLRCSKPELEAVVQEKLRSLRSLWQQLEATSGTKAKRLFEADRAELCAQACAQLA
ncbi:SPTN2 protein, partial [Psilopogon haemacephalus]|nr:SPTN2 protein [Psilopogon haemacephalus]